MLGREFVARQGGRELRMCCSLPLWRSSLSLAFQRLNRSLLQVEAEPELLCLLSTLELGRALSGLASFVPQLLGLLDPDRKQKVLWLFLLTFGWIRKVQQSNARGNRREGKWVSSELGAGLQAVTLQARSPKPLATEEGSPT